jgi:hypothetical protein
MLVAENASQLIGSANIGESIVSIIPLGANRSWCLFTGLDLPKPLACTPGNRRIPNWLLVAPGSSLRSAFSEVQ